VARQGVGGELVLRGWRGPSARADAALRYICLHVGVATRDLARWMWSWVAIVWVVRGRMSGRRPRKLLLVVVYARRGS
jgi:hypothetical protein